MLERMRMTQVRRERCPRRGLTGGRVVELGSKCPRGRWTLLVGGLLGRALLVGWVRMVDYRWIVHGEGLWAGVYKWRWFC